MVRVIKIPLALKTAESTFIYLLIFRKIITEKEKDIAVLSERNRIARELHDAVKQQVFALALQMSTIERKINTGQSVTDIIHVMKQGISSVQQELNLLLAELRTNPEENRPFSEQAKEQIDRMVQARDGVSLEFSCAPEFNPGSEDRMMVLRIIQDAVSNSLRHSGATKIMVKIFTKNNTAHVIVSDSGIGMDQSVQKPGYGLASMRERAALLPNGNLQIDSVPNEGTTVTLEFQL